MRGRALLPREVTREGRAASQWWDSFLFPARLKRTPLSLRQAAPVEPGLRPPVSPLRRKWPPGRTARGGIPADVAMEGDAGPPPLGVPGSPRCTLMGLVSELDDDIATPRCHAEASRAQGLGQGPAVGQRQDKH